MGNKRKEAIEGSGKRLKELMIIDFLIVVLCVAMAIQDFRDRLVSVIWFPVLAGLLLSRSLDFWGEYAIFLEVWLMSLILLVFFAVAVIIYSIVRKKKFSELIGAGDVLFVVCTSLIFTTLNFLFFLILSFVAGFVFGIMQPRKTVPLVAFMSGFLALIVLAGMLNSLGSFPGNFFTEIYHHVP